MTKSRVVAVVATLSFALFYLASLASAQTISSRDLSMAVNADTKVLGSIKEIKVELVDKVRDGCWPNPDSTKNAVQQTFRNDGFKFSDEAVVRVLIKAIGYRHRKTCIASLSFDVRYTHAVPMPSAKLSGPVKAFDRRLGTVSIAESDFVVSGSDLQDTITDVFSVWTTTFQTDLIRAR